MVKNFCVKKNFGSKNFWLKFFLAEQMFWLKKIRSLLSQAIVSFSFLFYFPEVSRIFWDFFATFLFWSQRLECQWQTWMCTRVSIIVNLPKTGVAGGERVPPGPLGWCFNFFFWNFEIIFKNFGGRGKGVWGKGEG